MRVCKKYMKTEDMHPRNAIKDKKHNKVKDLFPLWSLFLDLQNKTTKKQAGVLGISKTISCS